MSMKKEYEKIKNGSKSTSEYWEGQAEKTRQNAMELCYEYEKWLEDEISKCKDEEKAFKELNFAKEQYDNVACRKATLLQALLKFGETRRSKLKNL